MRSKKKASDKQNQCQSYWKDQSNDYINADFERALKEQRERHAKQSESSNSGPVGIALTTSLNGLHYNPKEDKYFRKLHSSRKIPEENICSITSDAPANGSVSNLVYNNKNILHNLLMNREVAHRTTKYDSYFYANMLRWEQYEAWQVDNTSVEKFDMSYHPSGWLAIFDGAGIRVKLDRCPGSSYSVSLPPSVTAARIRLQWSSCSTYEAGVLVGTVTTTTSRSLVFYAICERDISNTVKVTFTGVPFQSGSDGTVWNAYPRWVCGEAGSGGSRVGDLLLCCDSGLVVFNLQAQQVAQRRNFSSPIVVSAIRRDSAVSVSYSSHEVYTGARNGTVSLCDLRTRTTTVEVGRLTYCTDHVYGLADGRRVVAQDVLGNVRLFDVRHASSSVCVRAVDKAAAVRHRRFWVSERGDYVASPMDSVEQERGDVHLALWSLSKENTLLCSRCTGRAAGLGRPSTVGMAEMEMGMGESVGCATRWLKLADQVHSSSQGEGWNGHELDPDSLVMFGLSVRDCDEAYARPGHGSSSSSSSVVVNPAAGSHSVLVLWKGHY